MTFNINIADFKRPSLTTQSDSFWWLVANSKTSASVCTVNGVALLAAFQKVLHDGVKPPWKGFSETATERPGVDGSIGYQTIQAAWVYLQMQGVPSDSPIKDSLTAMMANQQATPALALIAVLCAYYLPRIVVADDGGTKTLAPRITRSFSTGDVLFQSDKLAGREMNGVFVSNTTVMWPWLVTPSMGKSLDVLAEQLPQCKKLSATNPSATSTAPPKPQTAATPPVLIPPPPRAPSGSGSGLLMIGAAAVAAYFLMGKK